MPTILFNARHFCKLRWTYAGVKIQIKSEITPDCLACQQGRIQIRLQTSFGDILAMLLCHKTISLAWWQGCEFLRHVTVLLPGYFFVLFTTDRWPNSTFFFLKLLYPKHRTYSLSVYYCLKLYFTFSVTTSNHVSRIFL